MFARASDFPFGDGVAQADMAMSDERPHAVLLRELQRLLVSSDDAHRIEAVGIAAMSPRRCRAWAVKPGWRCDVRRRAPPDRCASSSRPSSRQARPAA